MKKVIKKIARFIFLFISVILILLITVPYFFKKKIETLVIQNIDKKINAKVFFKDLRISAFKHFPHITVTLYNVSVTGVADFTGDTLVSAKEIDATIGIYTFLKGKHEVNGIHLQEPLIYARILENGKASYDIAKPDTSSTNKSKESSFEIAIDHWSINNGRIVYDDKLQKTYLEIGGLYHNGSGDFKQEVSDLDITTKINDLTFQYNGIRYFNKKLFAADLQMEMNLKEKKFTFRDHAFQLGDFKFGFDGYFKLLDKGYETDLKFVVNETSFKNLLSLFPGIHKKDLEGIETNGEFTCNGNIRGVYDIQDNRVPTFHIDLKVMDATFKYNHLPKALEKINFDFVADNPDGDPEHTTYNIKAFHFEIDKQSTHGSITIKGKKNIRIKSDIKLSANLAEIENLIPLDGLLLKGKLDAELNVDGIYNDSLKLLPAFHVDMKAENAMFRYKKLPKSIDNINFHLIANNVDGDMEHINCNIPVFHFEVDKNPVHGNIFVKGLKDAQVNADIKIKADLAHIEKIYPIDGLILKGILNSEIKINGRYNDSLKLFPKADVFVALEKGYVKSKNMPAEMDSIHLSAEVTNITGKIADTRISLNNLTFLLDGEPFVMSGTMSDLKDYNYDIKINGLLDLAKLTQLYPIENTSAKGTFDFDIITKG
ncbi:MAG TPA: AsmA family protein, partial [Bacteroidia bacterium]|nr:AsmA family protein [Bacteroidia bacterium]